jgi:16S rRNA (uracil1498-N3)-methyltransferase
MQLFYHPHLDSEQILIDAVIDLPQEEALHAIRVLRYRVGDTLWLTDGKGNMLQCKVSHLGKRNCSVQVDQIQGAYQKRDYSIHIAVAPTKNISRLEWFLEKATEFGVDEITPLLCQHSERKQINPERLNKVITSAMKQSLKAWHPQLHPLTNFKDFVGAEFSGQKFVTHLDEAYPQHLKEKAQTKNNYVVLIGPEGDFSPEEIELAQKHQWSMAHLGPERLRTETAALAAVFTLNLLNT